ncbi:hypothetical protein DAPPUDRAFT_251803 [Daphnia pulex]|uniref:Uncharacterized protein n=1 Tax=Daphnia pulex TaxID=6669 RepID=E9H157_DAPPU|nr:hypothetical protein DAPPUDRAFT_251803 [Daphnia pulex]|eukprot:EFX74584.1 hypothetical protein DAPPUDRAFT_251803 [Daphnia pulex]
MLRTTLQPHLDKTKQSSANVLKNQFLLREVLLAKLTGPPETKPTLELASAEMSGKKSLKWRML